MRSSNSVSMTYKLKPLKSKKFKEDLRMSKINHGSEGWDW
ncbi:hypothetical protein QAC21B_02991 [Acinetobacter bohemicus]|nr:hypothetical protein QAC21B_02835 [Acinetobacter bohemicus]CAD9196828.1 hypothetical protein QAC21B_02991 [Acinetobacter bohemicus]